MSNDQTSFPWSVEKFAASLLATLIVKAVEAVVRHRWREGDGSDRQDRPRSEAGRRRWSAGTVRPGGRTRPPRKDAERGRRPRRRRRRSKH